ncbi:Amidases related to nicotinamidase (plasmid) [Rubrobacter radiotolerans]|uniref:Amidases related to nicotinamidase n=1 Tax=Rubrobacter radiotolerans TaxID=42256 RepID=A0A023X7M2_RUBRA|nr:cysteine hydrolase [Rubrobacter radiotolerans]AHY48338.1 Amidases related to nicotinamidase [Rubrobacter radiotolerans]MDX5895475.1 cysteine hydrolase [Rubrobacter radiotolerans]SMC01536.1 Nicotinamidase-related amidase [Rubrobacter radiotolerans DSM 5868]
MAHHSRIYAKTPDGGVQLASNADRWYVYEDYVHLTPHHTEGQLLKFDAELKPFVDNANRCALVITDMQNDFCSPGGWTDASGLDYKGCREAIPGIQRAIEAARGFGMWVVWVYWHNRRDLRNLGAPTLYSFKHDPHQRGIGEDLENGPVLLEDSWGAAFVDELAPLEEEEDIHIEKVRMSGFYGTHLDQVLRTQGINTLFFTGVNTDQCVTTTMEDAYFHDYNAILLEDATSTSSPGYCKDAVVFNAKNCWGFSTTTEKFAAAEPFEG